MITDQKAHIQYLRTKGNTYPEIGFATGLTVAAIKAFCWRNNIMKGEIFAKNTCDYCGTVLVHTHKRKIRRFCSTECRNRWWSMNRDMRTRNGTNRICINCESQYTSYDDASKYCCHACYISARFGKKEKPLDT